MCHRQRHTVDVSERDNCEREPSFLPLHVNYYYILYHTIVLQSFWLIRKPAAGMNSIVLRYFCASMSRQMGNRVIVWEKIFYTTTEQAYLLSLLIETKYSCHVKLNVLCSLLSFFLVNETENYRSYVENSLRGWGRYLCGKLILWEILWVVVIVH